MVTLLFCVFLFFFSNDTATTEIYTLSLHDALPIYAKERCSGLGLCHPRCGPGPTLHRPARRRSAGDRKSTRLNSSHQIISYAVFCLKKKRLPDRDVIDQRSVGAPEDAREQSSTTLT